MARKSLPVVALALFDAATVQSIIDYVKSNNASSIMAELDRTAREGTYLPPPIFGLASPTIALSEENATHLLQGLAAMISFAVQKQEEYGKAFYQELFEVLFGLTPDHAGKLADSIETTDAQSGVIDRVFAAISRGWNAISPDYLGLDVNSGNPDADLDVAYEMLSLGRVVHDLQLRNAMRVNRLNEALNPALPPAVKNVLSAASEAAGTGDLHTARMHLEKLRPFARRSIVPRGGFGPAMESGSFFGNLGQSLTNYFQSDQGRALATQAVTTLGSAAVNALAGPRAPGAPQAPVPQAQPVAAPAQAPQGTTTVGLPGTNFNHADHVAQATGGYLQVRLQ